MSVSGSAGMCPSQILFTYAEDDPKQAEFTVPIARRNRRTPLCLARRRVATHSASSLHMEPVRLLLVGSPP